MRGWMGFSKHSIKCQVELVVTQSKSFSSVSLVFYLTSGAENLISLLETFGPFEKTYRETLRGQH